MCDVEHNFLLLSLLLILKKARRRHAENYSFSVIFHYSLILFFFLSIQSCVSNYYLLLFLSISLIANSQLIANLCVLLFCFFVSNIFQIVQITNEFIIVIITLWKIEYDDTCKWGSRRNHSWSSTNTELKRWMESTNSSRRAQCPSDAAIKWSISANYWTTNRKK